MTVGFGTRARGTPADVEATSNRPRPAQVSRAVTFVNDADLRWTAHFDAPTTLRCASDGDGVTLRADAPGDGTVRVSLDGRCAFGTSTDGCEPSEVGVGRDASEAAAVFRGAARRAEAPKRGVEAWDDVEWAVGGGDDDETFAELSFSFADGSDLRYALPHHVAQGAFAVVGPCVASLHGDACPVVSSSSSSRGGFGAWDLKAPLGPKPSLSAPRAIPEAWRARLGAALDADVGFELPDYFKRGAGDTYFSGKMVAKQARLAAVAQDLGRGGDARRLSAKILETTASFLDPENEETRFLFDEQWGGMVSCGCDFDEATQTCRNARSEDCPGLDGCGNNFGNGWYNDHHYHYGYWAYATAVACKHVKCAETFKKRAKVLALDFANFDASSDAPFAFARHKDWFLGSSWASGVCLPANPNGRNQESSSEAVHAYEGAFHLAQTLGDARWADFARLLAATEVDAARRYWHTLALPSPYAKPVVGMYWSTMAQFGTWFGASPAFAIGIQLMPLTPYSEVRDGPGPAFDRSVVGPYADACDDACTKEGWSISLAAALANAGDGQRAIEMADAIPDEAFLAAGGDGHSRTNLLHWIATRPGGIAWTAPTPPPTPAPGSDDADGAGTKKLPRCETAGDLAVARLCPLGLVACVEGPAAGGCAIATSWAPPDCARSCFFDRLARAPP